MGGSWDCLGEFWLDASFAATLLFSTIAVAMLGCRQPARRVILARGAIVGSLVLIPLAALAPVPRFELISAVRESRWQTHPLLGLNGLATLDDLPAAGAASAWTATFRMQRPSPLFTLAYLGAVALGLGGLLLGHCGLRWLTRRAVAPSDEVLALYDGLPFAGRAGRPRLRIAPRLRRPVLVGLFRPTILIPRELEAADAADRLRLGLLHELAHARARDPWFGLASSLAQAFWFFLPPLWWIRAQLKLDQEFLADHHAARGFRARHVYASSLLDCAEASSTGAREARTDAPQSERPGSTLYQRVSMLVQCPFAIETRPPAWWRLSIAILVAGGTLALASLSLQVSESLPVAGAPVGPTTPQARSFRLSQLVLAPQTRQSPGHGPLFELPLRLPATFELSLDVWGDRDSVSRTRVVGRRLGPSPAENRKVPPDGGESWHHVFIRRDARGLVLLFDGAAIASNQTTPVTTWLSVEPPPGLGGRFRNLILAW